MEAIISEYIVWGIDIVMTIVFCLYVLKDCLRVRTPVLGGIAAALTLFGAAASLGAAIFANGRLPFTMDYTITLLPLWLAAGLLLLRWASKENWGRLVFVLLLSVQALHFCQAVTYFTYGLFFPALAEGTFCWADILGFGIPRLLITLPLAVFCQRLYSKLLAADVKQYVRLWVVPLFFVFLYFMQSNLYSVNNNFTLANGFRIIICVCAFMTYSQMASAVSSSAKAAKEAENRAQLAHQLDLQRARVEDLESHAEEMKRIRHDRRQHVRVLRGLLEKGEVKEALAYLEDYEGSMAEAIQPPLCENFVADTLCRRYEALAKQAGVEVSISALLPKEPGVAGSDLAVILGNLWENAVAAALDAGEGKRFIRLRVQAQEEQVLIRMENGYGGLVYQEGERLLSSKPGRNKAEGVGIASVRAMAVKYGGMADFTYTLDTFTASVLLYTGR
ncbi:ATP-binding protein [Lacrimispora sp. NSJ-141]|uniref:ATP-binding protein n=1 Tax=Lientehia hominis TaxID=2897778 RepID=A0AAP2RJE3_9FIRM|nr:ATP-binding protein [Lientehia hominis]MCD2492710.1 ATP-binding protein [Lientehia hominis]